MSGNGRSGGTGRASTVVRRRDIYELLLRNGAVNVSELADAFAVRTQTIRNDLDALQSEGKVVRSYGGAVVHSTFATSLPYSQTRATHSEEKALIGQAAVSYVPDTDSGAVYLNSGTTVYQLATRFPSDRRIQVITNSPEIAAELSLRTMCRVTLLGGKIVADALTTDISASREFIERLYFPVAFLSCSGIDIERGITDIDPCQAEGLGVIIEHSSHTVMLCDSSKFGRIAHAAVGPVDLIDVLITDSGVDQDSVKHLRDAGVKVLVAGREN